MLKSDGVGYDPCHKIRKVDLETLSLDFGNGRTSIKGSWHIKYMHIAKVIA